MHAFDRRTDGRTDRNLIARPRLHSMQRGKNDNQWLQHSDSADDFIIAIIVIFRITYLGYLFPIWNRGRTVIFLWFEIVFAVYFDFNFISLSQ